MKKEKDELQQVSFEKNNHSIIYAPNSTGKTRLTQRLKNEHKDHASLFLTAKEIDNMVAFNGRQIFIGKDSSFQLENNEIEKKYNNSKFSDQITKMYEVKTASSLAKTSLLFHTLDIKRKDTFLIFFALKNFLKSSRNNNLFYDKYELIKTDSILANINYDEIHDIISKNISVSLATASNVVSKELKEHLDYLASSIKDNQSECPLCGHDYNSNLKLKEAVKEHLKNYVIDSDAKNFETCSRFLNILSEANAFLKSNLFETRYDSYISVEQLAYNLKQVDNLLIDLAYFFVEEINHEVDESLYERYLINKEIIDEEKNKRINTKTFYSKTIEKLNEMITLPDNYRFEHTNDKVIILDLEAKKVVDPSAFLSESELKRMCIAIVCAEIEQRQLEYVVFDDPVDSNDDYYFDISANVIADLILSNHSFNWILLTHEFRLVSILSSRCTDDENCQQQIQFAFYLSDPLFVSTSGNKVPPYHLYLVSANDLSFLNEHETIIFKKIFTGVSGYGCDKHLALLASFNTARNLYNEILSGHQLTTKHYFNQSGRPIKKTPLKKAITKGNKTYEHYIHKLKGTMRLSTLYKMNNLMYDACSTFFFEKSTKVAANYRTSFLVSNTWSSIMCDNPVLKYILLSMIRVMNSHYLFEKKLFLWADGTFSTFNASTFASQMGIGSKLYYISSLVTPTSLSNYQLFSKCFNKWRGLLNDFAHSTSRMIPPYLTINPIEMSKLEKSIQTLP